MVRSREKGKKKDTRKCSRKTKKHLEKLRQRRPEERQYWRNIRLRSRRNQPSNVQPLGQETKDKQRGVSERLYQTSTFFTSIQAGCALDILPPARLPLNVKEHKRTWPSFNIGTSNIAVQCSFCNSYRSWEAAGQLGSSFENEDSKLAEVEQKTQRVLRTSAARCVSIRRIFVSLSRARPRYSNRHKDFMI